MSAQRWEIYNAETGEVIDIVIGSEALAEAMMQEATVQDGGIDAVEYNYRRSDR